MAATAAAGAGAAAAAAAAARPGVAYALSHNLYLNLTQRCNAVPLHETRGPGFVLPPETGFRLSPSLRGGPGSPVFRLPLPPGAPEPSAAEVAAVIRTLCAAWPPDAPRPPSVVFAGAGEPLLALDVLLESLRAARCGPQTTPFDARVTTNGLFPPSVARQLREAGVTRATVALASSEPRRYARLMRPEAGRGLDDVCAFIVALVEAGGARDPLRARAMLTPAAQWRRRRRWWRRPPWTSPPSGDSRAVWAHRARASATTLDRCRTRPWMRNRLERRDARILPLSAAQATCVHLSVLASRGVAAAAAAATPAPRSRPRRRVISTSPSL
jgi:hypothetical protein